MRITSWICAGVGALCLALGSPVPASADMVRMSLEEMASAVGRGFWCCSAADLSVCELPCKNEHFFYLNVPYESWKRVGVSWNQCKQCIWPWANCEDDDRQNCAYYLYYPDLECPPGTGVPGPYYTGWGCC
jgi:hypothetical protein